MKLREWIWFIIGQLQDKLPPGKRRLIFMGAMGGVTVLVFVIIGVSLRAKGDTGGRRTAAARTAPAAMVLIPPDDVFLPDEPDFIPGVILERQPRAQWTSDDAAPLWVDPLKKGEEPWRDRIEQTIDEIMERVP